MKRSGKATIPPLPVSTVAIKSLPAKAKELHVIYHNSWTASKAANAIAGTRVAKTQHAKRYISTEHGDLGTYDERRWKLLCSPEPLSGQSVVPSEQWPQEYGVPVPAGIADDSAARQAARVVSEVTPGQYWGNLTRQGRAGVAHWLLQNLLY